MGEEKSIKLSNGNYLKLNLENPDQAYNEFVDVFFKPTYVQTNDLNKTIHVSIMESERISTILHLSKGEVINSLLKTIEGRLPEDIAELTGDVDKIEILFENVDDYEEMIIDLIENTNSQEDVRLEVSRLLENLNLFEQSELIIHFAKKIMKK
jgi:Mg2+ and Co2+ transporter CorA